MFIRKATFEFLMKRSESQQQQIDELSGMVGIIAKSLGQQLELDFGKDWNTGDRYINSGRQEAVSSDWSF
jgi:NTP pyrophosphatase (non-canonical NTP hydrolase)